MYSYIWDLETGGLLLTNDKLKFSKNRAQFIIASSTSWDSINIGATPKTTMLPSCGLRRIITSIEGERLQRRKADRSIRPPELIVVDDSDCGDALVAVDIPKMVERNRELLETLSQETVKKAYGVL